MGSVPLALVGLVEVLLHEVMVGEVRPLAQLHVLELPLKGDVALIKADLADRWGNLTYNKSARNFGPTMAMAADLTIAQVRQIVDLGEISPEVVVTPGIFVDRVVEEGDQT